MLATCYGGCEVLVVCVYWYCRLISFAAIDLAPLPPHYAYTGPDLEYVNKCECSTVGYSLINACVACQGQSTDPCDHIMFSSQFPRAYGTIHALAGLDMCIIAQLLIQKLFYLLRSEFPLEVENLLHLTL